jgi:hypothetical protein
VEENSSHDFAEQSNGKVLTILIIIVCLVFFSSSWGKRQPVESIKATGLKYLTEQEIIGCSGFTDSAVLRHGAISLTDIERNIVRNKFIRSVQAWRTGLGDITVEVTEREPVAAICGDDGILRYLDSAGVFLPYRLFAAISDVPIFYGIRQYDSTSIREQCLRILQDLRNYGDESWTRQIGTVTWNADKRYWQLHFEDYDISALVSPGSDMYLQLSGLHATLKDIGCAGKLQIDLRWENKSVVSAKAG